MPPRIPNATVHSSLFYYRAGSSAGEYHAVTEATVSDGYTVTVALGRRRATAGAKTPAPGPRPDGPAARLAEGHRSSDSGIVYQPSGDEATNTGILPQLANPVEESELPRLLDDHRYCLQPKHGGRRVLVRMSGSDITGVDCGGLAVALPGPIHAAVAAIGLDLLIDGEVVGDTLFAFDLLDIDGANLRQRGYLDRFRGLATLLGEGPPGIIAVATCVNPAAKRVMFTNCRDFGCEGVVFKAVDAPFAPGRPASGGPQLKYKFVETASFVVTGINA